MRGSKLSPKEKDPSALFLLADKSLAHRAYGRLRNTHPTGRSVEARTQLRRDFLARFDEPEDASWSST
jgi:hypothetical protein